MFRKTRHILALLHQLPPSDNTRIRELWRALNQLRITPTKLYDDINSEAEQLNHEIEMLSIRSVHTDREYWELLSSLLDLLNKERDAYYYPERISGQQVVDRITGLAGRRYSDGETVGEEGKADRISTGSALTRQQGTRVAKALKCYIERCEEEGETATIAEVIEIVEVMGLTTITPQYEAYIDATRQLLRREQRRATQSVDGESGRPTKVVTAPAPRKETAAVLPTVQERIRQRSREQYARPWQDVEKEIEQRQGRWGSSDGGSVATPRPQPQQPPARRRGQL